MNTPDTTTPAAGSRPDPVPAPPGSSGRHLRVKVAHLECECADCDLAVAETGEPAYGAYCDTCQDPDVYDRYNGEATHTVAWPCPLTARPTYGPIQAADRLGLDTFQLDRAVAAGLIPAPTSGRWPGPVIDEAVARIDAIRAQVGSVPDLGAVRAAEVLSARLGVEVSADAVAELHRAGLLDQAGTFRGHPLYDGRQVEAFTDTTALAKAERDGRLLTRAEAADRLRVRRVDIEHLLAAGLLQVAGWGLSPWQSRRANPEVPLLRAGDLDVLAADPRIDWAAVRAAGPGRPSPPRVLAAAAGGARPSRSRRGAR